MMAGLACGEPSLLAWQELERGAAAFMAMPGRGGDRLHAAAGAARHVASANSGVAGLAGLPARRRRPGGARDAGAVRVDSRVLLFGTEGASDPDVYARYVEATA